MEPYIEYMDRNGINNNLNDVVFQTFKHLKLEDYLKIYLPTAKGKKEINSKNKKGWTPLMTASRYSNKYSRISTVKLLINNGANLNLQNKVGNTALMLVSEYTNVGSSIETLKLLIDNKADLNIQNKHGQTALILVLDKLNSVNSSSTLETLKILIDNGANLDLFDKCDLSALMHASMNSKNNNLANAVKLLINKGANVNLQRPEDGHTALHFAVSHLDTGSNLETVKFLIANGANVDVQDKNGVTPLMNAVDRSTNAVELLINNGANLYIQNGSTILIYILEQIIKNANDRSLIRNKHETFLILLESMKIILRNL